MENDELPHELSDQLTELNETMKRIRFELRDLVAVLKEMNERK